MNGRGSLGSHLSYLQRDGVTRDGEPGKLFGADSREVDPLNFAKTCDDDRHHFRFIVSPEDAASMSDLKRFTRDLMGQMEKDLGTRLDWAAVDHWNTEHPHIHIIVRGPRLDNIEPGSCASPGSRLRLNHTTNATINKAIASPI